MVWVAGLGLFLPHFARVGRCSRARRGGPWQPTPEGQGQAHVHDGGAPRIPAGPPCGPTPTSLNPFPMPSPVPSTLVLILILFACLAMGPGAVCTFSPETAQVTSSLKNEDRTSMRFATTTRPNAPLEVLYAFVAYRVHMDAQKQTVPRVGGTQRPKPTPHRPRKCPNGDSQDPTFPSALYLA